MKKALKILAMVSIFFIVGFIGLVFFHNSPYDDKKFNQMVWKEYYQSKLTKNLRGPMVRDLEKNILHEGMKQEDVINLLGEPDYYKSGNIFKYSIGAWSGYGVDYESLDIYFKDGKIIKNKITIH